MHPHTAAFRTDINGLRAYAVLMVLGYHFMLPGFGSGFAGVDIFFVISGFLMASIIVPKLDTGKFWLPQFYAARLRRILPALGVVCAVLLLFGWHNLGPTDYAQLGKHAASAVSFISNFIFRAEDGYFDAPSRDKWLLHTWSLSVEAQFYALFPLLLMALRGRRALTRLSLLWSLAVLSFLCSVIFSPTETAFSFYLLPTRAWELLSGSLLFLHAPRLSSRQAQPAYLLGMALIITGAFLFARTSGWPGPYPLWPVAGALLVLAAARSQSFLLGNPLAQRLGLWSYSIYLWHWPLMVGFTYFDIASPWLGMGLSILLGGASYRFVEQPCRRYGEREGDKATFMAALALLVLIGSAGVSLALSNGHPARLPAHIRQIDSERDNRLHFEKGCGFDRRTDTLTPCYLGRPHAADYILWGDSHAGAIASALRDATGGSIRYYTHSCATLFGAELRGKGEKNHCRAFNDAVMREVDKLPRRVPVIIANRYAMNLLGENETIQPVFGLEYSTEPTAGDPAVLYAAHMKDTLCRISRDRLTYVVLPQPEIGRDVPRSMVRQLLAGLKDPRITYPMSEYRSRNAATLPAIRNAAKACPNIRLLDPIPYLCKNGQCETSLGGLPLYVDDDHLSERGNRLLVPMFQKALK